MPTPTIHSDFRLRQMNGNGIDLTAAGPDIKVALFEAGSGAPNDVSQPLLSDIPNTQIANGGGYTTGGALITGRTVALDGATPEWVHDDVEWAQNASGFTTARYAVWYVASGTNSGRRIMTLDLLAARGNVNGPFKLDVNAATGVMAG